MSYSKQPDHPISTMGASDWASINAAGNMLLTKCLLTGPIRQGGVVVIRSCKTFKQRSAVGRLTRLA